jgi:uncharacterized protein
MNDFFRTLRGRATRLTVTIVICAALEMLASVVAHAQTAQFVLRSGADTLSIERFTRSRDRLEGTLLLKPTGSRVAYKLVLAPDATVSLATMDMGRASDAQGAAPEHHAELSFQGDSVVVSTTPGGVLRIATERGAIPYVNPSMAMIEQVVRRARTKGGDSVRVDLFAIAGGRTIETRVNRLGADSVVVGVGGIEMRLAVNAAGDILGGTIPVQHLQILRGEAGSEPLTAPKPDYSAPAGAPYSAAEVRVPTSGGFDLVGTLTAPLDAKSRVPCVVTITGSGLEDRDEALSIVPGYKPFRQVADALARRGIATLRLDDRGFGASGGDPTQATSADLADDLRAALAWLRKREGIDGKRLALLGHSEGGIIAPMVAAGDSSVRAIVLLAAPSRTGRRVIEYQHRHAISRLPGVPAASRDSIVRVAMARTDSMAVGNAWLRFFMSYDPLSIAPQVHAPVLILQGANDRQVEAVQAGELATALKAGGNRDVTVHVLPGLNHLFLPDSSGDPARYSKLAVRNIQPGVLATIVDWLSARLK